ncbi:hypothetical protein Kpol_1024p30 [Vanderwaltozyma polyspora DSM 70294]|uniref:Uncharacterized protein n=1 Tax=Vanderwaltozyma polyspora (strain ATCC 22028 / DSM 70294 / BCRC 21397 / CBS 2163 / NBRC 10782 / NRRL Y-8283 / UCD 57-17) TaxID=436907 RepID=A7TLJ0_VANPO|nr:uncharacterized protein Kpol_1024p30 [Vanderwaltozyma polyspora DSM 70294]EDO16876.1 hypothetical protein Kpol_1024p30 [Vanderwaltozyma polyspora DSM 70294]
MLQTRFVKFAATQPALTSLSQRCLLSTSRIALQSGEKSEKKSKNEQLDINVRHIGVASDIYIPPTWRRMPNMILHPISFFNVLIRKIYTLGFNTVQIAVFRNQSGIKPKFLLWKNNAIETYVNINKAFAERKIEKVSSQLSIWAEDALKKRQNKIPKNIKLDWKLLKFNEVPKLVSLQPLILPGQPLEHIQLVYRFNTKQRLLKLDKDSKDVEKVDRDVTDFVVFLCDASTNEVLLIGSVFESKPDAKLPKNYDSDNKSAVARMRECGDIYRSQIP